MAVQVEDEGNGYYTVSGITNTAGEPELYRVRVNANGQCDIFVERKKTGFAILNPNKHYSRYANVLHHFKINR